MRLLILKTTKSSYIIQLKFFSKSPCKIEASGDFPGAPVVKTLPSDAGGVGSIPCQGAEILYAVLCYANSLQSCPTPSDPMDCSLTGSSAHGIFQARVLEWGAIAFSEILYGLWPKNQKVKT